MAARRANNEGSVYKDGRRWVAALVVGHDPETGRLIRRRFTAKTRKEVTAKLEAAKAAVGHGLVIPDDRTSVADFIAWWVVSVLPGEGLAPRTERWYVDTLTGYVAPQVGHRTLTGPRALTPGDVEAMTAALATAGYSHRVQVASRMALGKVLRAAEARGLVGRNVARIAKPPRNRGKAREVKALTVDEVRVLIDGLEGSRWHPPALVGVVTGLRPGELLALHWADLVLDGDEARLAVRHALSHANGAELKAPKRERSYRTVPLPPEAAACLRSWRKMQAEERLAAGPLWSPDWPGLVFTNSEGLPLRVDGLRQAMRRVLPDAHPHRLRHSYATHLLEAGLPIHHVAELLGDAVATVEASYSHVMRTKHEAAGVASGLLSGGRRSTAKPGGRV